MERDTSPFPVKMNGDDLKIELVKTKDEKKKKKKKESMTCICL